LQLHEIAGRILQLPSLLFVKLLIAILSEIQLTAYRTQVSSVNGAISNVLKLCKPKLRMEVSLRNKVGTLLASLIQKVTQVHVLMN
jgi:hypothetical protein